MKLFPTSEEYGAISQKYPAPQLIPLRQSEQHALTAHKSLDFGGITIAEWFIHLANRMIHSQKAYHLMLWYFDLGIPDDRPWISPGSNGVSVEYFPDFQDEDYSKRAWFSFYADTFTSKLFSAWDTLGQLLVVVYGLEISRPSFYEVARKLRDSGVPLGEALLAIWNRNDFERFRAIRHDATHNFLPGTFGGSIRTTNTSEVVELMNGESFRASRIVSFGVGQYVTSKEMLVIIRNAMDLFDETLRVLGLRGNLAANSDEVMDPTDGS